MGCGRANCRACRFLDVETMRHVFYGLFGSIFSLVHMLQDTWCIPIQLPMSNNLCVWLVGGTYIEHGHIHDNMMQLTRNSNRGNHKNYAKSSNFHHFIH